MTMTDDFYILIDADIVAYQTATIADQLDPFDGTPRRDITLQDLVETASADIKIYHEIFEEPSEVVLVFSPSDRSNFRKSVDSTYKQNRNPKPKPKMYWELVRELKTIYNNIEINGLEGDDVLGIMHTRNPKNSVMVSSDKDMKTIPGRLYDFHHNEHHHITPNQANYNWMYQTLMGDSTDGYPGCPGIGKKKAAAILPTIDENECEDVYLERMWFEVLETYRAYFKNPDVAESAAVRQARLARILRCQDYDWVDQTVRLWHPKEAVNLPLNR
tara:strand:+ start:345 stop:1163 length:819 start_codon:yes stop_codon:yes gene_type:complete